MTKAEWKKLYRAFRQKARMEKAYHAHHWRKGPRGVTRKMIEQHQADGGLNVRENWLLCCAVFRRKDSLSDGAHYYRWRTAVYDRRLNQPWDPLHVVVDGKIHGSWYHPVIGRSGTRREQFDPRGTESKSFIKWCSNWKAVKQQLLSPTLSTPHDPNDLSPSLGGSLQLEKQSA